MIDYPIESIKTSKSCLSIFLDPILEYKTRFVILAGMKSYQTPHKVIMIDPFLVENLAAHIVALDSRM